MAKIKTAYLVVDVPADPDAKTLVIYDSVLGTNRVKTVDVPSPRPTTLRIPVTDIPYLVGKEGTVSAWMTWSDGVGNESDVTTVTGPLDLKAPTAPTGRFEQ